MSAPYMSIDFVMNAILTRDPTTIMDALIAFGRSQPLTSRLMGVFMLFAYDNDCLSVFVLTLRNFLAVNLRELNTYVARIIIDMFDNGNENDAFMFIDWWESLEFPPNDILRLIIDRPDIFGRILNHYTPPNAILELDGDDPAFDYHNDTPANHVASFELFDNYINRYVDPNDFPIDMELFDDDDDAMDDDE